MTKKLLLAGLAFLFLSCLSMESKMTLAQDGSGTIQLTYTVSSFARDWDALDNQEAVLPLPINESDFRRAVSAVPGLSLDSYSRADSGDSSVIQAVLGFASLEALNSLVSGSGASFALSQEGGRTVFEQTISPGTRTPVEQRARDFITAFFQPYVLDFSLTAPRAARSSSPPGKLSGNQASVSFPLPDVLQSPTPVVWRVEW
ncbi:MAG: hypothetical protein LBT33_10965 [Spirochaetia bacterium]|jgi:hypothetical protein|nr:hypothetical protein [Spirochaetia bacterium]